MSVKIQSVSHQVRVSFMSGLMALLCGGVFLPFRAGAEPVDTRNSVARKAEAGMASEQDTKLDVVADQMEYDAGLIRATGHVIITKGFDQLTADRVIVNRQTEDVDAFGDVTMKQDTGKFAPATNGPAGTPDATSAVPMKRIQSVWTGTHLKYNFKTRVGDADALVGSFAPYHIIADKAVREGHAAHFQNATITTCTNEIADAHYRIRARQVDVVQGETLKAYGCLLYLGPVPIFYTPYMYKSLNGDFGFRFFAGYHTRMGAFLLSSCYYRLSEIFLGETHVDYRTKRGVALGQDLRWKDPNGTYHGEIESYFLNDKSPWESDDDPVTSGIKSDRYRFRLRNTDNMTPKDYSFIQADYLSDSEMLADFFEDEYRASSQPDNYVSLTHKEDEYTVTLLARSRLNDFYENVNRIPELSMNIPRIQMGDSIFYYEGAQTLSALEKVYSKSSGTDSYSAFRADSLNTIYMPTKEFGFLNVTPRVGYRGTDYSATPGTLVTNSVTVETNTNDMSVTTNVTTSLTDGPGVFRSSAFAGLETSFKAYKTWDTPSGTYRHIVEPYADYTFVPEPTEDPSQLYQFDSVDSWGKQNYIKLGNRHKLQVKDDNGNPDDLIDADIYTILNVQPGTGTNTIQNFYYNIKFTPDHVITLDLDGYYDTTASELHTFNSRLTWNDVGNLQATTEYRYTVNESSELSEDATFFVTEEWAYNIFGWYNLDESRVEQVGGYLEHHLDCISWKTGVTYRPSYTSSDGTDVNSEFRCLVELWVNALDKTHKDNRYQN